MNSALAYGIIFVLVGIYLSLVLFVLDTGSLFGLIQIAVLTVVIFGLIISIDKKREKGPADPLAGEVQQETNVQVNVQNQQTQQPAQPTAQPGDQQQQQTQQPAAQQEQVPAQQQDPTQEQQVPILK